MRGPGGPAPSRRSAMQASGEYRSPAAEAVAHRRSAAGLVAAAPSVAALIAEQTKAGRDLAANAGALAWLATVRQADRVWGRAAARKALLLFLPLALATALTLWSAGAGRCPGRPSWLASCA